MFANRRHRILDKSWAFLKIGEIVARTVRDTNLETRTTRARLAARGKPYWRTIEPGCHLGYRRGKRGGSWTARRFLGDGKYSQCGLGKADDILDSDGAAVLTFKEAQQAAGAWFRSEARREAGLGGGGPCRVREAVADYLEAYKARGKAFNNTTYALNAHVLPAMGEVELSKLTSPLIRRWRDKLATTPPRIRSRKGGGLRYRTVDGDDPEAGRRRRVNANYVMTLFKAVLNQAYNDGKTDSDRAWALVKPYRGVDAARARFLSDAEARRLVNAAGPDFRRLVRAALYSGARYGELGRLRCHDFDRDSGTLHVRVAKAGKGRRIFLDAEAAEFFSELTAGRAGDEVMLVRESGGSWDRSNQTRPMRQTCERGNITPAGFHCLRHSAASRWIMAGVSLSVVAAQLGHADTRMVDRHYGHLADSHIRDAIRAVPALGIDEPSNVARIDGKR